MTENKRVKIAYLATIGVLLIQIFDVFFWHNQSSVFSTNIIARLIGIVSLVVLSSLFGLRLEKFCFKTYGWYFEILYGAAFSIVPVVLTYLFKYVYFYYRGYENLVITFQPQNIGITQNSEQFAVVVIIYILTIFLVAVFKEVFYRGFLISQLSGRYGVSKTVLIQAVIYTISFLPTQVYDFISGKYESESLWVSIAFISGHLLYSFICGLKWGMFYKVNGTVWMSAADNFITNFLSTSFYFTESRLPEKWFIFEIIAMQIVSALMFLPFYMHRDKQNELAAAEYALSKEALKMGFDNYNPSVIRKRIDEKSSLRANREQDESQKVYEEPISLDQIKLPNEEDLTLSVRGYEINDSGFTYNNEIADHDCNPSEKSQEFFDNLLGKAKDSAEDLIDEKSEKTNAENISDLVKNYFDEDFNKHTFTK